MEKTPRIYTNKIISIATFFGGPLAAGFLIGYNFKILGDSENQRYSIIIGIISTLVFFELLFLVPDKIMNSIPNAMIPSLCTAIIYFIVHKIQDDKINEAIKNGVQKASGWKAVGIGLLCSIFIVGYIFLRASSMPLFPGEVMTLGSAGHEIYYHKNISSEEVKKVGEELIKFGYFSAPEKQPVQLTIEDKTYCLKIFVPKDWWDNEDILESMRSLQGQMSKTLNRSDFKIIMLDGSLKGFEEKDIN